MPLTETRAALQLLGAGSCTPAPVVLRVIALLLDAMLVGAAACLIFFRLVSPEGLDILDKQYQTSWQQNDQTTITDQFNALQSNQDLQDVMTSLSGTAFAVLLLYFVGSEVAMDGATLGKRVFGLRVARWPTGDPPTGIEIFSRNIFKCVSLCWPPLLIVELIPLFSRRTRRAAHDYLARTIVTGDALPPPRENSGYHDDDE